MKWFRLNTALGRKSYTTVMANKTEIRHFIWEGCESLKLRRVHVATRRISYHNGRSPRKAKRGLHFRCLSLFNSFRVGRNIERSWQCAGPAAAARASLQINIQSSRPSSTQQHSLTSQINNTRVGPFHNNHVQDPQTNHFIICMASLPSAYLRIVN